MMIIAIITLVIINSIFFNKFKSLLMLLHVYCIYITYKLTYTYIFIQMHKN